MAAVVPTQSWTYAHSVANSTPAPSHATTGTVPSTMVTPAPAANGAGHPNPSHAPFGISGGADAHPNGTGHPNPSSHPPFRVGPHPNPPSHPPFMISGGADAHTINKSAVNQTHQATTHQTSTHQTSTHTASQTVIQSAITQEVKSAMTHVLSNVPWMKFRIHAEPDLTVFEHDVALQQALTQISQVAATSIAQTITSEFTSQMQTLVETVTKSAATQISATLVQLIQELVSVSTLTHCSTNSGGLIIPGIPDCITGNVGPYKPGELGIIQPSKPGGGQVDPHSVGSIVGPNFDTAKPTATTPNLQKAGWIWTKESLVGNPPGGPRPFRKTFTADTPVDHLAIDITCDNYYTLYVNGSLVGSGRDWTQVQRYQVTFPPTRTVTVAVYGVQDAIYVAQAGLIAACTAWSTNNIQGGVYSFVTDDTWKTLAIQNFPSNFMAPNFPDASWDHATVEGPYGMPPWGNIAPPSTFTAQNGPLTQLPGRVPNAPSAPAAHVIIT